MEAQPPWRSVLAGRRAAVIVMAGVAAQALLLYLAHFPVLRPLQGDEHVYRAHGLALAAGRFPESDLIWPPLGGWWLGVFYRLFGPGRLPVELAQSAVFVVGGLLLRALALRARLGVVAADMALLLYLLDPEAAAFAHYLWPEVLHVAFMLLAACLLFLPEIPGPVSLLGSGFCLGLALLTKSVLGPFVPAVLAAATLRPPAVDWRRRLQRAAILALALAGTVAPVVVVNGVRHGVWRIADSGAFNVWVGLNDPSSVRDSRAFLEPELTALLASPLDPAERNRRLRHRIADFVRERGVARVLAAQGRKQYYRLFDKDSFFTDQLSGGRLGPAGVRDTRARWLAAWAYGAYLAVLVLAAFGLFQPSWQEARGPLALAYGFLAYNLLLFLFVHAKSRFRLPLVPVLVLFAGVAVARLASRHGPEIRAWRLGAGAVLAAVGLHLALSGP